MSDAAVLQHKAHACRLLIHVAGDEVVASLLRERAEEYESMATDLRRCSSAKAPKAARTRHRSVGNRRLASPARTI